MALKIRIGEHCTHIIHSLSTSRNMDPIKLYNPNLHKCHDDYHRTETNGKTYITIWKVHTVSETMSKRLDRLFRLLRLLCLMKYFWAWLATCVGVLVCTKFLEIPLQSPFPNFWRPSKNNLCSSSVHGTPDPTTKWIHVRMMTCKCARIHLLTSTARVVLGTCLKHTLSSR